MTRRSLLLFGLAISCALFGCATVQPSIRVSPKLLIEFG